MRRAIHLRRGSDKSALKHYEQGRNDMIGAIPPSGPSTSNVIRTFKRKRKKVNNEISQWVASTRIPD